MSIRVAHIWRHPIKGIGCEACQQVDLSPDGAVIGDRAWALLNADAPDIDDWQPRRNFFQVASGPMLSPVIAQTQGDKITLRHPDKAPLTINPETDGQALRDWVAGLWPQGRPGPARLVRAPAQGMTDVDFPSVSIGNLASLKALSDKIGAIIDMRRFRINLWLDGMEPWSEGELLSGDIRLGNAQLTPVDPIERCRAPDANPETGIRDVTMLAELERGWNTRDFGVYFKVTRAGSVALGDTLDRP